MFLKMDILNVYIHVMYTNILKQEVKIKKKQIIAHCNVVN